MATATGKTKTTPDARENASEDVFAKEFLVHVDDSANVPDEFIESNKASVVLDAEQRGLRATGDVKLVSKKAQDDHNVLLAYSVPVKSATESK